MNTRLLTLVAVLGLVGCGGSHDVNTTKGVLGALAEAGSKMVDTQKEAEKFYNERKAKGDTIAMAYSELQKFLPSAPSDYTAAEAPTGSSQSMGGFSMSQTEATFNKPAAADGTTPSIQVSIVDFGGTQSAYTMMALPMMMNMSSEDAHQKMQTLKMGMPYTWGSEEFNKDDKTAKVTLVTRYRYVISVEARNQGEDKTAMAKSMAEEIAKKFDGK